MSTVDDLLSIFNKSRGGARANRYRVIFDGGEGGNKISFLCDSVTLPGRQILTSDYATTMKTYKRPYAFANDDVTMSFILTNDWFAWNFLNDWQSKIISNIDSARNGPFTVKLKSENSQNSGYIKQVLIQHLTVNNKLTKTYILYDAYPVTLNSMELSNSSENQILRCTVTLAYDNWTVIDGGFLGGENVELNLPEREANPILQQNFQLLPNKEQPINIQPNFESLPRKEQPVKTNTDFGPLPRKEQPVKTNPDFGPLPSREQPVKINPDFGPLPSREQPVKINPDFGPLPSREQPVKTNPDFGPLPRKEQPVKTNTDFGPLPSKEQPVKINPDFGPLPRKEQPVK